MLPVAIIYVICIYEFVSLGLIVIWIASGKCLCDFLDRLQLCMNQL